MRENRFQEFDRRRDERRERELEKELRSAKEMYKRAKGKDISKQKEAVKEILDVLETMKLEAIDIDEILYAKMQQMFAYLENKEPRGNRGIENSRDER